MATLREIRNRISGVRKTQKITKAMKMVAAAKLRRAQTAMLAARPYAMKIRELLAHLTSGVEMAQHPLVKQREIRGVALVIVTSDRGLCGPFNSNLIRAALQHINTHHADLQRDGRVSIFCVGKKGYDVFSKRSLKVAGKYIGVYNNLVFGQAQSIAREVVDSYRRGECDRVELVFNEFKSVAQQKIVVTQFLPIVADSPKEGEARDQAADYLYEPSRAAIIDSLLPRHLDFQIWRSILESNAAEQGSRMAAMENATVNANEMITTLQLSYNKARQAAITKELLEVVGGAEALKKAG